MSARGRRVFATVTGWDPDEFAELGDELRRGAGAEFLAEAATVEEETHLLRRRRLDLGEVARELVHRGDVVDVRVGHRALSGVATFAGSDYLTIRGRAVEANVRLGAVALAVTRRSSGGHPVQGGAATFKARLAEFEHTGEVVTIVAPLLGLDLEARIRIVAADHLVADDGDGTEWVVPVAALTLVLRALPSSSPH